MKKEIVINEHRQKLKQGIDKLANIVSATLGPSGTPIILDKGYGEYVLTKDGVSVANSISLVDPIENMGAQLVKEVASKVSNAVGDGTSTATVLAGAIFNAGIKNVTIGTNPMDLKRGMDKAVTEIVESLRLKSKQISSISEVAQVGAISANNDMEIGKMIADAMDKVGKDGVITVEEGNTSELECKIVEGMELSTGYLSTSRFFINKENSTATYEDCYVLCCDKKLSKAEELIPILEELIEDGGSLLIIAEEVEASALSLLIMNKTRANLNVVAIKAPHFGSRRSDVLEDIAILTGGTFISETRGVSIDNVSLSDLGKVQTAIVSESSTLLMDGAGNKEKISKRINFIKGEIETEVRNANSQITLDKLKERLAKLIGGIAVISVGAATEVEMKEKKDRVDDALHATRAAVQEGVVPGGGVALLRIAYELGKTYKDLCLNEGEEEGFKIILEAIKSPFRAIISNTGKDYQVPEKEIIDCADFNMGYNAHTYTMENLIDNGIIDPTKVSRLALENAASIASLLLLSKGVVYSIPSTNPTEF